MEGSIVISALEKMQTILADWPLLLSGAATLGLLGLVYAIWLLHDLRAELRRLPSDLEQATREPGEILRVATVHLEDISQKLSQIIPPNFRVRSIRADNLVVRPGGADGRASRRAAQPEDFERW